MAPLRVEPPEVVNAAPGSPAPSPGCCRSARPAAEGPARGEGAARPPPRSRSGAPGVSQRGGTKPAAAGSSLLEHSVFIFPGQTQRWPIAVTSLFSDSSGTSRARSTTAVSQKQQLSKKKKKKQLKHRTSCFSCPPSVSGRQGFLFVS